MIKSLFSFLIAILLFSSLNAQEWEQLNDTPFDTHHAIGFSYNGFGYSLTGTYTRAFYQYDPSMDSWEQLADYPGPPRGFGIGDTWEGKLYFGFGAQASSNYLNDLWVYDPLTDSFEQLPDCPGVGRAHPAFVILKGKIYMGMGSNFGAPGGGNLQDWWEYDIQEQSWKELSDFPDAKRHHPYQFAMGEYVYTGFGHGSGFISNEWYRYHPPTDMWESVKTLPAEGRVAGQQFSYNGKGYVVSGQGEDHGSMPSGEFWEYDAEMDEWTELQPHPGPSIWAPASFIIDGYVYLSTGEKDDVNTGEQLRTRDVYRYKLDTLSTSTSEFRDDSQLVVYPNPASDFIQLKTEVQFEKATILDVQGRQIQTWYDLSSPINISQIQSGIYYLKLENSKDVRLEKIIVE